jgi:hypothetical protein
MARASPWPFQVGRYVPAAGSPAGMTNLTIEPPSSTT